MQYLDTSLLVALFTNEKSTTRCRAWLRQTQAEQRAISEWVITEFSAALSIKMRTQEIDEAYRARALALFGRMIESSLEVAPITGSHFKDATGFVGDPSLALRAGDALHLAIAKGLGAVLCTLDKQLASAGRKLNLATTLV